MTDPLLTNRDIERLRDRPEDPAPALDAVTDVALESRSTCSTTTRSSSTSPRSRPRRPTGANARRKLAAGWRGLKSAVRGDSSFFAHFYRGTLIAITAALMGINQWSWCLLVLGASLVLIAELAHSAVDTLARAIGDPEEPRLNTAREIAAAGVLVAAVGSGRVTILVLSWKFFELLSWRL